MFTRSVIIICLFIFLSGCGLGDVKENFIHAEAISKKLENNVGLKPSFVGFNWRNGSLNSVNITFQGLPKSATLAEITTASKQAVLLEFTQVPKEIVVAFVVKP